MLGRLISYERRFKTGTKQQHTSSFDKHFERNLLKDCITELENQSKQNEVVNGLMMSFLKTHYAGSTEKHLLNETPNGSNNSSIERLSQESKEKKLATRGAKLNKEIKI